MRSPATLYRHGGIFIALAALFHAFAVLTSPADPPMTLADAGAVMTGGTMIGHWLGILGFVLVIAGVSCLVRHFSGHPAEAWARLGLSAVIVGGIMLSGMFAMHMIGVPVLQGAMQAGLGAVPAEHGFVGLMATSTGLGAMGGTVVWLGPLFLAFAMSRDPQWPAWLSYTGMVIGLAAVLGSFVLAQNFSALRWILLLGFVWLLALGWTMMQMAPAAEPAREAQPA